MYSAMVSSSPVEGFLIRRRPRRRNSGASHESGRQIDAHWPRRCEPHIRLRSSYHRNGPGFQKVAVPAADPVLCREQTVQSSSADCWRYRPGRLH